MKEKLLGALLGIVLTWAAAALGQQTPEIWINPGRTQVGSDDLPIDAVSFLNRYGCIFTYADTNTPLLGTAPIPYNTYDTLNYTNQGLMQGNPGFDFETVPSSDGIAGMAANFLNLASGAVNGGVINCGGTYSFYLPGSGIYNLGGNSQCLIRATNIVNSGSINMDASSLMQLTGKNVDLSRGSLYMANPSDVFGFFSAGLLDNYWGVGDAAWNYALSGQASLLYPPVLTYGNTDSYTITLRNSQVYYGYGLALVNFLSYTNEYLSPDGSSRLVQAVFLANTNPAFANQVYFTNSGIAVQWQWSTTNWPSGSVSSSNYLYVTDNFGETRAMGLRANNYINPQAPVTKRTYMPINYSFVQGPRYSTNAGASPVVLQWDYLGDSTVTNQYAAYEALFSSGTQLPTDVAGGNVTNMAGRIEVRADNLNLTNCRISSLNYLLLQATNHFVGSQGAIIGSPYLDLILRSTNSVMTVTNLVAPWLNHLDGTVELWSARYTNVVDDVTNSYHVLFVNSLLDPTTAPLIQTCKLTVTTPSCPCEDPPSTGASRNLLISDVLNVTTTLSLEAQGITLTTNALNPFTPMGQVNILNDNVLWPTATPGLQYLTNWGIISTRNAVYFGGSQGEPYPYGVQVPYEAFVNHGSVLTQGSDIWARYFENSGVFDAGGGLIDLQQACSAILTNGAFYAPTGYVSLAAGSLIISNHVIQAGGALTLIATNLIDDGSLAFNSADWITNKNFWSVGNGINLPLRPCQGGNLLGTTITNTATSAYQLVPNQWAAADLGCSPAGFTNNVAIGHLILDSPTNCWFEFTGRFSDGCPCGANALYVDCLDLRGFVATNVDAYKNYASIIVDPGMTVYYAQALANGVSIAERLNGKNGGRLRWVKDYHNGFFSSTNVVYSTGVTNRLNAALVNSCTIDSDGDGIPNCLDSDPVTMPLPPLSPATVGLSVSYASTPSPEALISWNVYPSSTNWLLAAPSFQSTNWQVLTNFQAGPAAGRVTYTNLIKTNGPQFYRVRVGSP